MAGFPLGTPVTNLVGTVFDPTSSNAGDNSVVSFAAGKSSELLNSNLHGFYSTMTYRGRMFAARTAHGGAVVPVYTATAQTFGIVNPVNSMVNMELITFRGDISATGTAVISELYLNYVQNAPLAVMLGGTCTPIAGGVQNLLLGGGAAPKTTAYSALTSVSQADTYAVGLGSFTTTSTVNGGLIRQFDGGLLVPPGTAIFVTSLVAQTSIMHLEFIYAEMPV